MTSQLTIVDHPLIQHKLTLIRRKETSTGEFRRLVREISLLLAYEVTRDLPLALHDIATPLAQTRRYALPRHNCNAFPHGAVSYTEATDFRRVGTNLQQ